MATSFRTIKPTSIIDGRKYTILVDYGGPNLRDSTKEACSVNLVVATKVGIKTIRGFAETAIAGVRESPDPGRALIRNAKFSVSARRDITRIPEAGKDSHRQVFVCYKSGSGNGFEISDLSSFTEGQKGQGLSAEVITHGNIVVTFSAEVPLMSIRRSRTGELRTGKKDIADSMLKKLAEEVQARIERYEQRLPRRMRKIASQAARK